MEKRKKKKLTVDLYGYSGFQLVWIKGKLRPPKILTKKDL